MHLGELFSQVRKHLPESENDAARVEKTLPDLVVLRRSTRSALGPLLYEPVLCLILQGRKIVSTVKHGVSFGPGECLLVSHHLPVTSQVTEAPYVALVLKVDVATIRRLRDDLPESLRQAETPAHAMVTHRADARLIDAMSRYVALAGAPEEAKALGPLVLTEIHYRLMVSPFGGMLRNLVRHDSRASTIERAIGYIRGDIRATLAIPDLARRVGMSESAFYKSFKIVTSTTPLQYQKDLRLLEAHRLLKTRGNSVTDAAYEVGYESASQFSREYTRKFGVSPSQTSRVE
jgi:AraC-like DNA-binding protein